MIIEIEKKINKIIEIIMILAGVMLYLIFDLLGLEW